MWPVASKEIKFFKCFLSSNLSNMTQLRTEQIIRIQHVPALNRKGLEQFMMSVTAPLSNDTQLCHAVRDFIVDQGLIPPQAKDIKAAFRQANFAMEKSYNSGIRFTSIVEENYPYSLSDIDLPPLVLSWMGNLDSFNNLPAVSIVGSREPGAYGQVNSFTSAELFAREGYNVISGLAKGCDAAAHKGATTRRGMTTAVLGHSLEIVYPPENRALANYILKSGGLLLSEYIFGTGVSIPRLLERNRIVSALSHGTLVIESIKHSGTMNMARHALQQKRLLAALQYPPSNANHHVCSGNLELIQSGDATAIPSISALAAWATQLNNRHYGHDSHNHIPKLMEPEKGIEVMFPITKRPVLDQNLQKPPRKKYRL
jgi:DNA processing protein